MLEEFIEVHFAGLVVRRAGVVLWAFGALWAFVVRRAGTSRLVILVEVDVDIGDEVLEGQNDGLRVVSTCSRSTSVSMSFLTGAKTPLPPILSSFIIFFTTENNQKMEIVDYSYS